MQFKNNSHTCALLKVSLIYTLYINKTKYTTQFIMSMNIHEF